MQSADLACPCTQNIADVESGLFRASNRTIRYLDSRYVKFRYFEKATKFSELSTVDFTGTRYDKSTVDILRNFVAFSEYMNFTVYSQIWLNKKLKYVVELYASVSNKIFRYPFRGPFTNYIYKTRG